jgi:hypothetical protein
VKDISFGVLKLIGLGLKIYIIMGNQFIYKKRKKRRHFKHKRESDRFAQYIISDKYKSLFRSNIKKFLKRAEGKGEQSELGRSASD